MFKFGQISIDPVALGIAGNAVLGIKDSGKTYTATGLGERFYEAGIPFTAIDPIGVWRFMRVPGKGRGYPVVVAGGKAGDLPLTPSSAPAIVEAAMNNGISLVLDLFSLELSKADWRRIVRDSVKLMLHRNQAHGMRHVFIEEAAEFVPQQVRDGDVYAEVEKLARMGGNSMLGYTLINQRAEEVNKAVLELCDNLFLHRQKGRNSITALSKWLDIGGVKDHKEITDSLSTLPTGECWAWMGESARPVRVKVPQKNSLHPDRRIMRGDTAAATKPAVDVGKFVETMRGTLVEVEEQAKANDPKLLRAEIQRLNAQVKRLNDEQSKPRELAVDTNALERAEHRGYTRGKSDGYGSAIRDYIEPMFSRLRAAQSVFDDLLQDEQKVKTWAERTKEAPNTEFAVKRAPLISNANNLEPAKYSHNIPRSSGSGAQLARAERLILTALAQYPDGRSKSQVAILTGYSVNGGGFNNAISSLRSAGRLEGSGNRLTITQQGLNDLGSYEPLPHGDALLQHWLSQVGKAERAALEALAQAYPRGLSKEELAQRAGYEASGGGFNNALSRLRTLELITGRGELQASEHLFG